MKNTDNVGDAFDLKKVLIVGTKDESKEITPRYNNAITSKNDTPADVGEGKTVAASSKYYQHVS